MDGWQPTLGSAVGLLYLPPYLPIGDLALVHRNVGKAAQCSDAYRIRIAGNCIVIHSQLETTTGVGQLLPLVQDPGVASLM